MKKLFVCGAVIALCLACGEEEGDGAVWVCDGGVHPHCGPGNLFVLSLGGDIFYRDGSGRQLTRVTDTLLVYEDWPFWAPDGEHIAFSGLDKITAEEDIYKIRKDGTGLSRLTYTGGACPAWSPDGRTIAYIGKANGDIWKVPAEGGEAVRLTSWGRCGPPSWSPGGERVVFYGPNPKDPLRPSYIWYTRADGTKTGNFTKEWQSYGARVAWRAGGEWLAAQSRTEEFPCEIWMINVKSGRFYQLTREPKEEDRPQSGATNPMWSEDGGDIYFLSDRGPDGIFKINVAR
jgi:Tol biopolymer transport system component